MLAIYAAAWIALEGSLLRVMVLAIGVTLVTLGYGLQRYVGGQELSLRVWLALAAGIGLAAGVGSGALAILFMALKSGLHAHGPEFTPAEVNWVASRLVGWAVGGVLGGAGVGLLLAGFKRGQE